jgi:hypothetical protein
MFPLDAFDEVFQSRFLLSFCKKEPNSHTTPLPVVCRIEFHMGFSPLLALHETTMWLSDQVGSQEWKVKLGSLKESNRLWFWE